MNSLGARLRGNKLLGSVWTSASNSEQRSSVTSHIQKSPDNIFSENDENREFVPQSSSTLTADISRTKTNFSKIPSKPFSGLQNLAIEVNLSRRFSWPLTWEFFSKHSFSPIWTLMTYLFPYRVSSGFWKLITSVFRKLPSYRFWVQAKNDNAVIGISFKNFSFEFKIYLPYISNNLLNGDNLQVDSPIIRKFSSYLFYV